LNKKTSEKEEKTKICVRIGDIKIVTDYVFRCVV